MKFIERLLYTCMYHILLRKKTSYWFKKKTILKYKKNISKKSARKTIWNNTKKQNPYNFLRRRSWEAHQFFHCIKKFSKSRRQHLPSSLSSLAVAVAWYFLLIAEAQQKKRTPHQTYKSHSHHHTITHPTKIFSRPHRTPRSRI